THRGPPGTWTRHHVSITPGCRLADLLGERAEVVSAHHQAPELVGSGLRVSAVAPDGTIEALEWPGRRFALGVLWHPEEDPQGGAPLFRALVEHARERAGRQGAAAR
ncbi:MAG TPA: gamma-glutamyl-gamma-aminobutyrate hydrolase family protein, partial [Gaiellales bacterium]|nr:gamma-glutamyl-gamma-aminobutyrate hydrolase family protein [Gaiellales bacterium]